MLTKEEIAFFNENSYLRMKGVYSPDEVDAMSRELDYVIENFVTPSKGWQGPWRKDSQYLSDDEESKTMLAGIKELQHFSPAWAHAILNQRLAASIAALIGPEVELQQVTLHAKGPEYGAPFPMHQDHPFYPHEDDRFIDALVHVDAGTEENGCIKFLPGSHKLGPLQHLRNGSHHLPTDEYPIEDAVSVPADAGDVVLFSINTIHGSAVNRTKEWRRLVRLGYRNPRNKQLGGQAFGRPGIMVYGVRPKVEGVEINPYGLWPRPAATP